MDCSRMACCGHQSCAQPFPVCGLIARTRNRQEPFWPEGLGVNRGLRNAQDSAWIANKWAGLREQPGAWDALLQVRARDGAVCGSASQANDQKKVDGRRCILKACARHTRCETYLVGVLMEMMCRRTSLRVQERNNLYAVTLQLNSRNRAKLTRSSSFDRKQRKNVEGFKSYTVDPSTRYTEVPTAAAQTQPTRNAPATDPDLPL